MLSDLLASRRTMTVASTQREAASNSCTNPGTGGEAESNGFPVLSFVILQCQSPGEPVHGCKKPNISTAFQNQALQ